MANKRSKDARFQLHFWNKLLEGRIALQKVVVASREVHSSDVVGSCDEATVKSVTKLLACLVRLRDSYRVKSQLKNEADETVELEDEDTYSNIDDSLLDKKHDDYSGTRNSTIEKWCEKTRIGTIPKKGYTALELPTIQLISNSLKDKDRLIKRTQIDRSNQASDIAHPEIFNDDDFYHILLKEVLSKTEGRQWAELQRTKYKIKRKAETKATKGRKIRKDLIPKLVNFMAPTRPPYDSNQQEVPERIREELLRSLFGGSVRDSIKSD